MTVLRFSIMALALASAGFAHAFDSGKWLAKRELLRHEAERLKAEYRWAAKHATSPAEGVVIPLETYPDGSVKSIVSAKKAQIFVERELVWAEGVEIRQLGTDGSLKSVIKADKCVFDRSQYAKSGWAEGNAQMYHDGTVFKGRNVYFSSIEEYVMSLDGSVVEADGIKMEYLK